MNITRTYDLETYIRPFWESDVIHHETVLFLENEREANLLFPADEIFAVLSSDLKTEYRKDVDWTLRDGCLVRLPGSSMPFFPLSEYYPAEHRDNMDFGCTLEGKPFIRYGEGDTFFSRQVSVTYRHSGKWTGRIPGKQDKFGRFLTKLNAGEPVKVLFFGDSITTGANSSGTINCPPYAEMWPEMVTSEIRRRSGNANVEYINTAVGGMDSHWGAETIKERVTDYNPDLLILAFGMNDGGKSGELFMELTKQMTDAVQNTCPGCDIAIVATMLPHYRVAGFFGNQPLYEPLLEAFAADEPHIGVVPMTSVHDYLLNRKEYYHMTGNNVNHPNDFLARAYAMSVISVLFG